MKKTLTTVVGLIEMARPFDGVIIGSAVILGMTVRILHLPSWNVALQGLIMGILLLGAMDTLNDIMDVETDTISKSWRPLPSGRVSTRVALVAVVVETFFGIIISLLLGLAVFVLVILSTFLAVAYSLWLKPYFFSKNMVVALALSTAYLAGALAIEQSLSSLSLEFWIIYALILLVAFCFEIHKDIADVEGDRATNVKTIPTVLGERTAVILSSSGYLTAWVISAAIITADGLTTAQAMILGITATLGLTIIVLLWKEPLKHVELTRRIATVLIGLMILAFVDNQVSLLPT